jgi:SET domain-containing protein
VSQTQPRNRDFIRTGRSRIEGVGVFAKRRIPRGTRIIEYLGTHVPIHELCHLLEEGSPPRTYVMALDDATAIDGARGGNDARYFNHSCDPNCEPYIFDGRVYIYAMREVLRGEELTFDYRLGPADRSVPPTHDTAGYRCNCRAVNCRGTLLRPSNSPAIPGNPQ